MLFSSYTFIIIFLPLLCICYYIAPEKLRNLILLCASFVFYAWGGPKYLLVMLASIAINYAGGLLSAYTKDRPFASKAVLTGTVILNLALLGYYKYTDFFIENINTVFDFDIPFKNIVLPIGISFYTFQGLSYVLDIRRGKGKVLKNPLKLALYISLFPQLIAGPIVRYESIAAQIDSRPVDKDQINRGIYRFILGLSKKVLLANTIGELAGSCFSSDPSDLTAVTAWFGAIAFTLQLYYDFSGYSDMAIGLGNVFGFSFVENFNYPYISQSITEFWRRWHISLSSWFRDYVYIPLGGNRKGVARQYLNIFIVWMLTGLWHGASWNFVAWGVYYAVLLMIEKMIRSQKTISIPRILKHVYAMFFVTIGWVIFESPTLTYAMDYIQKMFMFTYDSGIFAAQLRHIMHEHGQELVAGLILAAPVYPSVSQFLEKKASKGALDISRALLMTVLFAACMMRLVVSSYNPFIYFRF